jgi:hypothetical protein
MADISPTFETRKLQWRFSRAPAGGTVEDVAVFTLHYIKASAPNGPWDDANDLPNIESTLNVFWTTIHDQFPAFMRSDQYRWYKDGPAFYELAGDGSRYIPKGGNAAVRVTEVDSPGLAGNESMMPPQIAMSLTLKTSMRKSWGRFYLPAPAVIACDYDGRIYQASVDKIANAALSLFGSNRAGGYYPSVFSIQKPARLTHDGKLTLPAQDAIAYEVKSVQMDNLFDVIRRRRWDGPTYRVDHPLF